MATIHMTGKKTKPRQQGKHVPQRTCVVCRQVGPKRSFVRLVLTPGGAIEVDTTGKRSGRGVYLCSKVSCWGKRLSEKVLGYAFRTKILPQGLEGLRKYLANGNNLEEGEK